MSANDIVYQVNIFVNNSDVNYTPETARRLLNLFSDFGLLPSPVHELHKTTAAPVLRPKFSSPEDDFSITILSQSISIEKNFNDGAMELNDFLVKADQITQLFLTEYKKHANRISFITKSILSEMNFEQLESIYSKFSNPAELISEISPFEWSSKSVRRLKYNLADEEDVNFVSTISRIQGIWEEYGIPTEFDRITIDFDINTVARNDHSRFSAPEIKEFVKLAHDSRNEILGRILEVING